MSVISLRVYDTNGSSFLGFLPDFRAFSCNNSLNDTGSFTLTYAYSGTNAALLTTDSFRQLAVFIDGTERYRFLIEEDTWKEVGDSNRGSEFTVSGRGLAAWLSQSTVYPRFGIGTSPASVGFSSANAGLIMKFFIDAAKARGCYPNLTYSFTNTLDTSGAAWAASAANIVFPAGKDVLAVLDTLVEQGLCDYRMNGNALQLYNAGATMAQDKSATVVLRAGLDIAELNRKRTRRDLGTAWLVQGDNEVTVERSDSAAITAYGRVEKSLQQGGVTDATFLGTIADSVLALRKSTKYAKTVTIIDNPTGAKPFVDFVVGDKISVDVADGTAPASLRVQTLAASVGENGIISWEMDLGDKFIALEEKFARQIAALSDGNDVTSSPVSDGNDGTIPDIPGAPSVSASAYQNSNGDTYAIVTVVVTPPSVNTDGSPCTDIASVQVQWRYDDAAMGVSFNPGPWNTEPANSSATQILRGIRPGATIDVQARVIDTSSNVSAWGTITNNFVVANDTTVPPTPSTPSISVKLGVIELDWDGLDNTAAAQPIDYDYTEIHMSTTTGFTPGTGTLNGTFNGAGTQTFVNLTYGTPYYFKLVSVDKIGNKSGASAQVTATPVPLVRTDIGADSITYNEIAFKDTDNYVEDGSFENATVRSVRSNATVNPMTGTNNFSFAQTNKIHGDWYLLGTSNGTGTKVTDLIPVAKGFHCVIGEKYYVRCYSRKDSATIASLVLSFDFLLQNGTTSSVTVSILATANATWEQKEGTVTVPANAVKCSIRVVSTTHSAGTISIDAVEVRKVMATALIDDAAITNAKIANLAVNDAKINDLTVAKLTAGTLSAAVILSGSIKTGTSGARVEIDSAGIRAYNSGGTQTLDIASASGNITITGGTITAGLFQTATSGQRLKIQSTAFAGTAAFIGFLSGSGLETAPATIGTYPTEIPLMIGGPSITGRNSGFIVVGEDSIGTAPILLASDSGITLSAGALGAGNINLWPGTGSSVIVDDLIITSGTIGSIGDITIAPASSTNTLLLRYIIKMSEVYSRTSAAAGNMLIATSPLAELFRSTASSRRWKNSIQNIEGSEVNPSLLDLPVRAFKFNKDYLGDHDWRHDTFVPGFIAEEVAEIYPIAIEVDEEGLPMDWNIRFMVPAMLREIQRLADRISVLEDH